MSTKTVAYRIIDRSIGLQLRIVRRFVDFFRRPEGRSVVSAAVRPCSRRAEVYRRLILRICRIHVSSHFISKGKGKVARTRLSSVQGFGADPGSWQLACRLRES